MTTPFLHSSSTSFNSVYYFQFDGNDAQEDVDKFMDGRSKIMLGEEQKGSDSESEEEIDVVRSSPIRSVCSSYITHMYISYILTSTCLGLDGRRCIMSAGGAWE